MRKLIKKKGTDGKSHNDYIISKAVIKKDNMLCRHLYFKGVWVAQNCRLWIQDEYSKVEIDRSISFSESFFEGCSVETFFTEGGATATCITLNDVKTYTFVDKFESVMFKE